MATTTTNDVLNVLYNQLEGKQNSLSSLKSMYGDDLGEYLYNTFVAQVAEWAQTIGDVTYNPYTGVIYIGANFTGLSDEHKEIVKVGDLCEDARNLCHETWLNVFTAVHNYITTLEGQAQVAYTEEQLALLLDVKTAINDNWAEWTSNWFTTVDATGYDASVNNIGELTFVPADGVTIKANAGGSTTELKNSFEGTYTLYGGTGTDTLVVENIANGVSPVLTNWENDVINFTGNRSSRIAGAEVSGNDVVLSIQSTYDSSNGTLTLKDMVNKSVLISPFNKDSVYEVVYGTDNVGSSTPSGRRVVVGAAETAFVLPTKVSGNVAYLAAPNIDATKNTVGLTITSNEEDNEIWLGSGGDSVEPGRGNDTVHGGNGADTVVISDIDNNEKDVLMNWSSNDVINFTGERSSRIIGAEVSENDVVLSIQSTWSQSCYGTLTIKGMANKSVLISPFNKDSVYEVVYGTDNVGSSTPSGRRVVVGAAETAFVLPVKGPGYDTYLAAPNIDATKNTVSLAITGNEEDNEIWLGSGGHYVDPGRGNDIIHGGAGADTVIITNVDDGEADVLMNWSSKDVINFTGERSSRIIGAEVSENDVVLSIQSTWDSSNGTLTIKGMANKELLISPHVDGDPVYKVVYGTESVGSATPSGRRVVVGAEETNFALPVKGNGNVAYLAAPNIDATKNTVGLTITGNEEDNEIWLGSGGHSVDPGRGNDIIHGGAGADTVIITNVDDGEADVLMNWSSNDVINFTGSRSSKIMGAEVSGNDVILSIQSTWDSSNGTLTIKGMANKSVLISPFNKDSVYEVKYGTGGVSDSWAVLSDSISSASFTIGSAGAENYLAIANIDARKNTQESLSLTGNNDANIIWAGSGGNYVYGYAGNDILYGGAGNDTLVGGSGADIFEFGEGNDIITDFANTEDAILYGSTFANLASSISGSDVLLSAGESTLLIKNAEGKVINLVDAEGDTIGTVTAEGGLTYAKTTLALDSTFIGTEFDASQELFAAVKTIDAQNSAKALKITGNSLANTIKGGNGNDFITGGTGNDTLTGGAGKDTFVYARGDGNDTITDFTAGTDKIRYTSGSLTKAQISGNDVLLYNGTGYQKLAGKAVKGQYADIVATNGTTTLRHNFGKNATANSWDYAAGQGYHGSSKVDTLVVKGSVSRTINLGNAALYTSIDNINASSANAAMTLTGTGGANTILGGSKNDTIKGGSDNDVLKGNAGNDSLYGEAGNDAIYGGAGNDTLSGGAGNDIFYYAKGEGNDVISDFAAGKDKIRYTSGSLTKAKISGSDVYLYNGTGYQKLAGKAVKGQYADIVGTNGKTVRHNFGKNNTANSWSYAAGQGYHGSSKVDTLTITGAKSYNINLGTASLYTSIDNVNASKASAVMTLTGTSGANTLIGGSKNDIIKGGAGNDNLQGGSGNDKLYAQSGSNTLLGGAGNDYLEGGSGTDILRGGAGSDTIKCGKGVDKIQFYKGDGKDTIQGASKNDILYLYNISNIKTQAKFKMSGKNLVMSFTNNKNDAITLTGWSTSGMNKFVVGNKTYSLKASKGKVSVR